MYILYDTVLYNNVINTILYKIQYITNYKNNANNLHGDTKYYAFQIMMTHEENYSNYLKNDDEKQR